MRAIFCFLFSLLLSVNHVRSGAIYRQNRELDLENGDKFMLDAEQQVLPIGDNYVSELPKEEVPVQLIEIIEPVVVVNPGDNQRRIDSVLENSKEGLIPNEIIPENIDVGIADKEKESTTAILVDIKPNDEIKKPIKDDEKKFYKPKYETDLEKSEKIDSATPSEEERFATIALVAEEKVKQELKDQAIKEFPQNDQIAPIKVEEKKYPEASVRQSDIGNPAPAVTATTARPSTQQPGFIQTLVQPLGQLFSNIGGGQQQSPQPIDPAAPTTIATNLFQQLQNNTSQLASSLQQGIQQQFAGFQQQLQSTFNIPGAQQSVPAASGGDSVTNRPQGPIQSFVTSILGGGGNNNQQASPPTAPQPSNNPLQGIINLFTGNGNRPQTAALTSSSTIVASQDTNVVNDSTSAASPVVSTTVNDRIDSNNARESSEAIPESYEDSQATVPKKDEFIVVNDDVAAH